ncbi:MAG: ABC transporter permease subunit [Ilumatobacteraceae bacterium]
MADYAYYILSGSAAGAVIAAFALGLLITHQGSGIVNLAHGAVATWGGYVYADLRRGAYPWPVPGLPARTDLGGDIGQWPSFAIAVLTTTAIAVLLHRVVYRRLARAPELARVVAAIGVLVATMGIIGRRFGDDTGLRVDPILPRDPVRFSDTIVVSADGLWLMAIVIAAAVTTAVVWRFTQFGLVVRAAASNAKGLVLLGRSPDAAAAAGFALAAASGAAVVILASPMVSLSATTFSFGFLVPALGAVLCGRFRSIPITVAAGVAIGLVQSVFVKLQVDLPWFPRYGAREGLPFVVILVVMLAVGRSIPSRGDDTAWRLPVVPPVRWRPAPAAMAIACAVIGVVALGPLWRGAVITSMTAMVLSLSLVVLTGFAGQVSLAHMVLAGVGAFSLSRFATDLGVPFPVAPLLAAGIATIVGVLVAVPAIRVRGTELAVVTLAGGIAIVEFVFKNPTYVGDAATGGARVPNPTLFGMDLGLVGVDDPSRAVFGVLVLVILIIVVVGVMNLRASATGRRILAVRSNERAAAAVGISVARVKLQAYAMSSFIAGLGGCLIGYRFGQVSATTFGVIASLTLVAFTYLGGVTSISGALVAGLLASSGVVFHALDRIGEGSGEWDVTIGGIALVVAAVIYPEGIAGRLRAALSRRRPAHTP